MVVVVFSLWPADFGVWGVGGWNWKKNQKVIRAHTAILDGHLLFVCIYLLRAE